MNRILSVLVPLFPALLAVNCSNDLAPSAATTGGTSATTGGTSATTGGTSATTGGTSATTGGTSATTGGTSVTTGGTSAATGGTSSATGGTSATTGGASATTGGTTGTGGDVTTGGTSAGGTTSTGGTPGTGGASTGGTTASGGAGGTVGTTGGTGTGGATGGTAGTDPPTITSTMFGDFNNAFMVTPCAGTGSGYDCPNTPTGGGACISTPWSYGSVTTTEATGNTYTEVFTVAGGDSSKIYDVTVHVVGQAEGRTYTNGKRNSAANPDPSAAANDLLYIGGKPGTAHVDYNVFQLTITGGTAIAGADTYFAFNSVDTGHEGQHYNYGVDSTFTFKVRSGMTVTLTSHDSNCIAIKNCGSNGPYSYGTAVECEANARSTPASVTFPATFRGTTITNTAKFQTQFLNFKVTSIVAE